MTPLRHNQQGSEVRESQHGMPSRRSFGSTVIYGLWAVIGAATAIPAGIYLLFPPRSRGKGTFVEATDVARLKVNTPEEVVFRRTRVDGWKVVTEKVSAWVVKHSDKDVVAFGPQCPHLGCAYHWEENSHEFLCPCHTSTFNLDGNVTAGPSPRPLDRFDVKVEGNKLLLGEVRRSDGKQS